MGPAVQIKRAPDLDTLLVRLKRNEVHKPPRYLRGTETFARPKSVDSIKIRVVL